MAYDFVPHSEDLNMRETTTEDLGSRLRGEVALMEKRAKLDGLVADGLYLVAIFGSTAAAICGFFTGVNKAVVSVLSLVPGLAIAIERTLSFQIRSGVYWEMTLALRDLERAFSVGNVNLQDVPAKWRQAEEQMAKQWPKPKNPLAKH
jgi:hypothetical protein